MSISDHWQWSACKPVTVVVACAIEDLILPSKDLDRPRILVRKHCTSWHSHDVDQGTLSCYWTRYV